MFKASNAYFQTQVTTTSQGEIVIMLYDGALNFLAQAKDGLKANNMAAKGIAISKTMDIINELDSSLNMDKGGSLARNLHSLYLFCLKHLAMANIRKSTAMIEEVERIISGLRSAYAEIAERPEAQAAAREAGDKLKLVNNQTRIQTGPVPAGPGVNSLGAGVRARSLYARNAEQGPLRENAPTDQEQAPAAPLYKPQSAPLAPPSAAAPVTPLAPVAAGVPGPADPAGQADQTAQTDPASINLAQGFPRPPAFGRARVGAYGKMAGQ